MAKYDHGGGCPCGLYSECLSDCILHESKRPAREYVPSRADMRAMFQVLFGETKRDPQPDQIIHNKAGEPYLIRWFVKRSDGDEKGKDGNVFLHLFLKSDDDRALHDHPWASTSIILKGQYLEHMPGGHIALRKAGDVVCREAEQAHRVELIDGEPVWTLFMTGPKTREWGFHCNGGWKHWEQFDQNGGCGT